MEELRLLPRPDEVRLGEGYFYLGHEQGILADLEDIHRASRLMKLLKREIIDLSGLDLPLDFTGEKTGILFKYHESGEKNQHPGAYEMTIDQQGVTIISDSDQGFFYGIQTLKQLMKQYGLCFPYLGIKDSPSIANRGLFLDLTRGRVLKVSKIKEIIDLAASLKYNQLQLYFEHTFAYSFFTEVSMGKDGITGEELKELDDYCHERHIELIPCIATFGHIFELLKSVSYSHLCEYETFDNEPYSWMKRQLYHTIDVTNPKSLELVEKMIDEIAPLIRSGYINICGDETYDLGKGRSMEVAEKVGVTNLYIQFLNKVISKVESLGKKAMFWGDVIVHHPEKMDQISQDALCLYWQYERDVPEHEVKHISQNRDEFYLIPASVGWNRFVNDYEISYNNLMDHGEYARKYCATGIVLTDWGDFGHINIFAASIPALYMAANMMWSDDFKLSKEAYGELISRLHYGDTTETLVKQLYSISEHHQFKFEYLMKWVYEQYHDMARYGSAKKHYTDYSDEAITKDLQGIESAVRQLASLSVSINEGVKKELTEILLMAEGIKWLLSLVFVIKHGVYGDVHEVLGAIDDPETNNDGSGLTCLTHSWNLTKNPVDLAVQMEKWLMTYESYWRYNSRESELYRIREVIQQLCYFLRTEVK